MFLFSFFRFVINLKLVLSISLSLYLFFFLLFYFLFVFFHSSEITIICNNLSPFLLFFFFIKRLGAPTIASLILKSFVVVVCDYISLNWIHGINNNGLIWTFEIFIFCILENERSQIHLVLNSWFNRWSE